MHSRESLAAFARRLERVPFLGRELRRQQQLFREKYGSDPDLARAWWTSPVTSLEAYQLERGHIEGALGVTPLVSLTDHDSIDAGCHLRVLEPATGVPISTEWTVPVGPGSFHLGVHNLPAAEARGIVERLAGYTEAPSDRLLGDLLTELDRVPDTLIVLNHPTRDDAGLGAERHRALLGRLWAASRGCIHAIELNGRRPWSDNHAAIDLACAWERAVVSGGDRHGFEPNAILNLSRQATFSGFAAEVRDGVSDVLVMDHYREPAAIRALSLAREALAEYPGRPGRAHWRDRVFLPLPSGGSAPFSRIAGEREPLAFRGLELAMQAAEAPGIRQLLRLWFSISAGARTG